MCLMEGWNESSWKSSRSSYPRLRLRGWQLVPRGWRRSLRKMVRGRPFDALSSAVGISCEEVGLSF